MENEKKAPAIKLTPEEMQGFVRVQDALRAGDDQMRITVRAIMAEMAEKRRALYAEHRVMWEAAERKYALDPKKHYELIHSTGEIVEHDCSAHIGGAILVNLSDLANAAMGAGSANP